MSCNSRVGATRVARGGDRLDIVTRRGDLCDFIVMRLIRGHASRKMQLSLHGPGTGFERGCDERCADACGPP